MLAADYESRSFHNSNIIHIFRLSREKSIVAYRARCFTEYVNTCCCATTNTPPHSSAVFVSHPFFTPIRDTPRVAAALHFEEQSLHI